MPDEKLPQVPPSTAKLRAADLALLEEDARRFGRLVVLERAPPDRHGKARYRCRCDCGVVKEIGGRELTRGSTTSCGCLHRERQRERFTRFATRHGQSGRAGNTPTYGSWLRMRQRCNNPANIGYAYYGGRGITVCARWDTFEHFLADMGERPAGTTLDRKNNNGNYEPGNCKWSTPIEQRNNRRDRTAPPDQPAIDGEAASC